jgi:hypothetical protein
MPPGLPGEIVPALEDLWPRHRAGTSEPREVKAGVFGLIDDSHPSTTQLFEDAVVRDGLADHWAEMLGPAQRQVNEARGMVESQCQLT